jgi:predicted AlkP superfamily pyrophosphatase or phosphodiesterase
VHRQLLIVVDGLRPDYVTQDVMPTLYALRQRGVVFTNHHAIYPTVTRVNSPSIATGSYPERHGLLGNRVFFPAVDPTKFLNTDSADNLMKIERAEGQLLTAVDLGETLQAAGKRLIAVSTGSSGSALLLNHKLSGGAIYHFERERVSKEDQRLAGNATPPNDEVPCETVSRWAVGTVLKGIAKIDPAITILWLTEPDHTAHENGIGAPATIACLRRLDTQLKGLEDGLAAAGLLETTNIFVTSDHGFSTWTGGPESWDLLKPFERTTAGGTPAIVYSNDGDVYVHDRDPALIRRIVVALQRAPGVGAIFTSPASEAAPLDGWVPGTLSFNAIRWRHTRSADILFSAEWTDETNAHGLRGTVKRNGVASHGTTSPFDVHNTLMASGPDIKRAAVVTTPSANVDLAPTMLRLLGVGMPSSMQGRVLNEALAGGPDPASFRVRSEQHRATTPDGGYSATASFSIVEAGGESFRYFDSASADRRTTR